MEMTPKQREALDKWVAGERPTPTDGPTNPQDAPPPEPPPEGGATPADAPTVPPIDAIRLGLKQALHAHPCGPEALSVDRWHTREEAWADALGMLMQCSTLGQAVAETSVRLRNIQKARKEAEAALPAAPTYTEGDK